MKTYYPPQHRATKFHCVHCGVFAAQSWREMFVRSPVLEAHRLLDYCVCVHCDSWSYWYKGAMIVPSAAPVPLPHAEMPENCIADYNEARGIVAVSPRSAAALVRLALQKLLTVLGQDGASINQGIAALVRLGLPLEVQQALDYCRVVGNNAVHPGEINLDDTPEIAYQLFSMMNFIVEDRISRPKQIAALYAALPEAARTAIDARDKR